MMRPLKKFNKIILILFILSQSSVLLAQQGFHYQASLPNVDSAAFYQVDLPPEILAKINADLSDIRIVDAKKTAVPYFFGNRLPVKENLNFVPFYRVQSNSNTDTLTTFTVQNKLKVAIDQLTLRLRNADVQRLVNLSGSDDLVKWYAIKENIALNNASEVVSKQGLYEQQLSFPVSTYRYYKIQINNQRKEAVSIVEAGIYRFQLTKLVYSQLPSPLFTQTDSPGYSTVQIKLNDAYLLNKLQLTVAGTRFYKRDLSVYDLVGKHPTLLANALLTSQSNGDLTITAKTRYIELRITNGDNPPLKITAVKAYSLHQSLVAYLFPGKSYSLLFGDINARAPNYDLEFYADSVQQTISAVQPGEVRSNPLFQSKQNIKSKGIPSWVIWASIVAALIVLSTLTYKMVKELELKKAND